MSENISWEKSIDAAHNQFICGMEELRFKNYPRNWKLISEFINNIPDQKPTHDNKYFIRDLGCGCGHIASHLSKSLNIDFSYTGYDCNEYMIRLARATFGQHNVDFKHMDVYSVLEEIYNNKLRTDILMSNGVICVFESGFDLLEDILIKCDNIQNIILGKMLFTTNENISESCQWYDIQGHRTYLSWNSVVDLCLSHNRDILGICKYKDTKIITSNQTLLLQKTI